MRLVFLREGATTELIALVAIRGSSFAWSRVRSEAADAQGLFWRRVPELARDVHDLEALARVAAELVSHSGPPFERGLARRSRG